MDWNQYVTLMAANDRAVYATQPGHHGVYNEIEKTSPTIYPHRLDTHEMRLEWVMKHEVWSQVKGHQRIGRKHLCFWLEHKSALLNTMISDIIRRLVAEGYQVVEKTHPTRGHWLEISWPEVISA